MRAKRVALACLIAWGLQSGVSFAENDWWDKWSGPGPFRGLFVTYRYLCLSDTSNDPENPQVRYTWLRLTDRTASLLGAFSKSPMLQDVLAAQTREGKAQDPVKAQAIVDCKSDKKVRSYLFATYRRAVSIHNDLVAVTPDLKTNREVHVQGVDLGYVDRFSRSFDMSLAVGYYHISGKAFDSFYRPSFTSLLEYSPLAGVVEGEKGHIVKFIVGGTYWFKELKAQQFCNRPIATCTDPAWHAGPEFIPHIGFLFDFSLLN
jgi:hypothetical protein